MLQPNDAYAIASTLAGREAPLEGVSTPSRLLVNLLKVHKLGFEQVKDFFPDEATQKAIFAIDVNTPPSPPKREVDLVPALPPEAQLTPEQLAQAQTTGAWLRAYVNWAGAVANQTPVSFHEGAAIWLAAQAIGRRCYVETYWGQRVYPNVYLMNIAPSTYYRKSTGFNLAQRIVRDHLPHLLMSEPGSPESFIAMLAGELPNNFDQLPPDVKSRLQLGQRFAGQQGLVRDEMSGLFKAMARDFMAGMKEHLMLMYDAPDYYDIRTLSKGLVAVRFVAFSMIGAATPAELGIALSFTDWVNGNLARFILLTPEPDYHERPPHTGEPQPPQTVLERWQQVYHSLPLPPEREGGEVQRGQELALQPTWSEFWRYVSTYERALREMTDPAKGLDPRLTASYGRLHVQALKLAILLATFDWEGKPNTVPSLQAHHWFLAQHYAERWRAALHRILAELSKTKEVRLEEQVLWLLKNQPQGMTCRDIYRALHSNHKLVAEALASLVSDGGVSTQEAFRGGNKVLLYAALKQE